MVLIYKNKEYKMFLNAMQTNDALTQNGAIAHSTTGNYNLDLFGKVGSARSMDLSDLFTNAFYENKDLAVRILQYTRDIRQGLGERKTFKSLMNKLVELDSDLAVLIANKIPELGRYSDLLELFDTSIGNDAKLVFVRGITDNNQLAAKWAPRRGKHAYKLARAFKMDIGEYRRMVASMSNTVEQKICARKWEEIDFSKLPSIASARYQKMFYKNSENYKEYMDLLKSGDKSVKINAGALYPYDIIKSIRNSYDTTSVADAQWKALPDLITGTTNILPLVDVSGSMECSVGGNPNLRCMDVAISLGLYVSERNKSRFKDIMVTFSENPQFLHINSDQPLSTRVNLLASADWGYNTDFNKVFDVLLQRAIKAKLPEKEMPEMILVMSDMEFDSAGGKDTNFEKFKSQYNQSGYKLPKIVFWNLHAKEHNPIKVSDENCALVSGCSPNTLKGVLGGVDNFNPLNIMLETVMIQRYDL